MTVPQAIRETVHSHFEKHRAEPDVTIEQYERRLRIALAQSVQSRYRIYLDLRYWIFLRDAAMGRNSNPSALELLDLLRRLVGAGTIFCPASEIIFYELLKQDNPQTRRVTAELIDELSLGVALCDDRQRVATEFAHVLYTSTNPDSVYPLDWLVWTKLSRIIWPYYPTHRDADAASVLVLQKTFVDFSWEIPLVQILEEMGGNVPPVKKSFDAMAERLNRDCAAHAHEIRSFEHAYATEVAGSMSLHAGEIVKILEQKHEREHKVPRSLTDEQRAQHEKDSLNLFTNALRLGKLHKELSTVHVHAICHAVFRRDSRRKFEGNDLLDFHHATAALGYCDVFLTERPLQAMLTSNPMAPHKELECEVISDIGEAISYLREFEAQQSLATQ